MNNNLELLEAEILKLAPSDRSRLLERIIASLVPDPEVEAAWDREAERREALMISGATTEVSAQEAAARLRSKLKR